MTLEGKPLSNEFTKDGGTRLKDEMPLAWQLRERLLYEVERQKPAERRWTIRSGGVPCYRVPKEMDSARGPCCSVYTPCVVHQLFIDKEPEKRKR